MRLDVQWMRNGERLASVRARVATDLLAMVTGLRTTKGSLVERIADSSGLVEWVVEHGFCETTQVAFARFGDVLEELSPEDALGRHRLLAAPELEQDAEPNGELLARWAEYHALRTLWQLALLQSGGDLELRFRSFAGQVLARLTQMLPHLRPSEAARVRRAMRAFSTEPRVAALGALAA